MKSLLHVVDLILSGVTNYRVGDGLLSASKVVKIEDWGGK